MGKREFLVFWRKIFKGLAWFFSVGSASHPTEVILLSISFLGVGIISPEKGGGVKRALALP
jgi:hypothetical protein